MSNVTVSTQPISALPVIRPLGQNFTQSQNFNNGLPVVPPLSNGSPIESVQLVRPSPAESVQLVRPGNNFGSMTTQVGSTSFSPRYIPQPPMAGGTPLVPVSPVVASPITTSNGQQMTSIVTTPSVYNTAQTSFGTQFATAPTIPMGNNLPSGVVPFTIVQTPTVAVSSTPTPTGQNINVVHSPTASNQGTTTQVTTSNVQPIAQPIAVPAQSVPVSVVAAPVAAPTSNLTSIEPYSDKSFKVSGDATWNYKNSLQNLGGRWNSNLKGGPGWIFPNTSYAQVADFVAKSNSGMIAPEVVVKAPRSARVVPANVVATPATLVTTTPSAVVTQPATVITQPSPVIVAQTPVLPPCGPTTQTIPVGTMQTINWTVPKPAVGMRAQVRVGTAAAEYNVVQVVVNSNNSNVETAYISSPKDPNNVSTLIICNKQWRVMGYAPDHTIIFL